MKGKENIKENYFKKLVKKLVEQQNFFSWNFELAKFSWWFQENQIICLMTSIKTYENLWTTIEFCCLKDFKGTKTETKHIESGYQSLSEETWKNEERSLNNSSNNEA